MNAWYFSYPRSGKTRVVYILPDQWDKPPGPGHIRSVFLAKPGDVFNLLCFYRQPKENGCGQGTDQQDRIRIFECDTPGQVQKRGIHRVPDVPEHPISDEPGGFFKAIQGRVLPAVTDLANLPEPVEAVGQWVNRCHEKNPGKYLVPAEGFTEPKREVVHQHPQHKHPGKKTVKSVISPRADRPPREEQEQQCSRQEKRQFNNHRRHYLN